MPCAVAKNWTCAACMPLHAKQFNLKPSVKLIPWSIANNSHATLYPPQLTNSRSQVKLVSSHQYFSCEYKLLSYDRKLSL